MPYGLYILILSTLLIAGLTLSFFAIWAHKDFERFNVNASSAFMTFSIILYIVIVIIKVVGPSNLVLYANSLDISRSFYENIVNECKNPDKIRLSECKAKITEAELDTIYNYNRFINELNKTKN